jgi:GntR family transcriptional regulator/MocR family aminotransferase
MPKRATSLDLTLPPRAPGVAAYRWLYDCLRGAILAGRLRPATKLPSTRELALRYGLARGTIVRAFEQLAAEGYLEGSVGAGTFVARSLPDDLLRVARPPHGAPGPVQAKRPPASRRLTAYARRVQVLSSLEPRPTRAFRSNLPAVDLFPTALWAQLAGRRLRGASRGDLLGCEPLGHRPLREAVADYLTLSRGVRCSAERVAIVSGMQEALDLTVRLLVEPGDRVLIEEPGYPGAALLFAAAGARVVPVEVDGEGLVTPSARLRSARLVYVTPAHQYPLGVTMSLPRRLALLEWARRTGARIFEDDYDSEFRYAGRPVPALQGLDAGGSVLFAGSFSKVLFPSLRLGYLVLPADLVERAAASRSVSCRHPPLLEQRVLLDFIAEGHFARHLRRMREVYAERLATLLEGARQRLAGLLELSPVEAGLQTSGRLLVGLDAEQVARAAADRGVEVVPLARFYRASPPLQRLQLGFAAVDPREIRRGVRELAAVLESPG